MTPTPSPGELWLPTGEVARHLGISPDSLKRWANPAKPGAFLQEGLHWRRGPFGNSARRWHLSAVQQLVEARALKAKPPAFAQPSQQAPAAAAPVVITADTAAEAQP
jgi:hypothetical protein